MHGQCPFLIQFERKELQGILGKVTLREGFCSALVSLVTCANFVLILTSLSYLKFNNL